MAELTVINDTHLGANRRAGTTVESALNLKAWSFTHFKALLELAKGTDLLINGDLFDSAEVDKMTEYFAYTTLCDWCRQNPDNQLYLAAGNHDLSKRSDHTSSFMNLTRYLTHACPNVTPIVAGVFLMEQHDAIVIPHTLNQDGFMQDMQEALSKPQKYIFVHANLMSPFTQHADHSLNVDKEGLDAFHAKGKTVVFAHEHNSRNIQNAVVIGNQIPMSISDCINSKDKQYIKLVNGELEFKTFIRISEVYKAVDWQTDTLPDVPFIRVEGYADYAEAANVIQKLKQFRQQSKAFVIASTVQTGKIEIEIERGAERSQFDITQNVLQQIPADLKPVFNKVINYER